MSRMWRIRREKSLNEENMSKHIIWRNTSLSCYLLWKQQVRLGPWVKFMRRRQMKKRCSVQMEWLQWFWVVQVTCYLYLSVFCFQGFFFWNKDRCQLVIVCMCVGVFLSSFFPHDYLISKTPLIRSAWFLDQVHIKTSLWYPSLAWEKWKYPNLQRLIMCEEKQKKMLKWMKAEKVKRKRKLEWKG